ncbi:Uncharacterized protein C8034_v012383 [Colletotrichum sidae]|uniref:Protein RTA1 n=1 Tax=Colletotrichum sidae TaxID=1347389 RepID=A0A4R8TF59_9PEZI|nr:Uncharacterized protein C8034_v012383 [Colletotrichum sidae]
MTSSQPCTLKTCDLSASPYGYVPSQTAPAIFVTIATGCLVANIALAAFAKPQQQHSGSVVPFTLLITIACVLELVGWTDRFAGARDPWAVYPYLQSRSLLTIAPVFITSSIYSTLSSIIHTLGPEHSVLAPHLYAAILIPLDALSLLLQIAGLAVGFRPTPQVLSPTSTLTTSPAGAKIVTAGLVLHLATLTFAGLLLASVLLRAARSFRRYGYTTFHRTVGYVALPPRFRILLVAVSSALVVLFGRLAFRVAEYAEGFAGALARDGEGMFVGLDGFLVAYALVAVVGCHPAVFLGDGIVGDERTAAGGRLAPGREMGEAEAGLEELRKVYRVHCEEEERLSRFERV